ncbi:MAG: UPF0175 family protein [Bryobacteraceae bacterium]
MPGIETYITLTLPQDIAAHLTAHGENLSHFPLEALALEAYREHKLSTGQLRRLLGYRTRIEVHAFLKDDGVFLHYSSGDLDHDRQAGDALPEPPAA